MIELRNVSKHYSRIGGDTQALLDIDLVVERGEFIAVTGPSACGKTTLLNIVGLIDTPSSGCYRFGGTDLTDCSEAELTELRKHHIGFIFQGFCLVDDLTVFGNVELPLRYRRLTRRRRHVATREILELTGLEHRSHAYPDELSPGEQQRVAIARALVDDPAVLLADEPTANLDDENAAHVLEMLETLHVVGTTILMVTHSSTSAARAERVVQLHCGRVVT